MNTKNEDREPGAGRLGPLLAPDPELERAAAVAVREVLRVQPGEAVLIVTNPWSEVARISVALHDAVLEAGGRPTLAVQPRKGQLDFAEEAVTAAMACEPPVIVSVSEDKLGKDRRGVESPYEWEGRRFDSLLHFLLHGKKSVRSFWSPRITRDLFVRTVPLDYAALRQSARNLRERLEGAVSLRITAPGGTDVTIGMRGRGMLSDDGDFGRPGQGGNLPAGEIFFSPELGTAAGTVVFDGSVATHEGIILPGSPIRLTVEGGFVTALQGGREAETLGVSLRLAEENARKMEAEGALPAGQGPIYARNARNLGEVGIGLNPRAEIVGNMLVDEKVYGTCHLAIGSNYDEDAPALIHLDALIMSPDLVIRMENGEERPVMRRGRLVDLPDPR